MLGALAFLQAAVLLKGGGIATLDMPGHSSWQCPGGVFRVPLARRLQTIAVLIQEVHNARSLGLPHHTSHSAQAMRPSVATSFSHVADDADRRHGLGDRRAHHEASRPQGWPMTIP